MADRRVRVGSVADFPEGRGRAVPVGELRVAVFRLPRGWFALQDACPHMGASLADGRVREGRVICHWHGWTFDLASGSGEGPRKGCAKTFPVVLEGDEVFLELPAEPDRKPWEPPEPEESGDEDWLRWDPDRFFRKKKP